MSDKTSIEWTDATWNPIRGCSRVSAGCDHCYAERVAARFSGEGMPYHGLAKMVHGTPHWTGKLALVEDVLDAPLRWRRPRRIFVNSMSDLFHENVPDEWIDRVFAVIMANASGMRRCIRRDCDHDPCDGSIDLPVHTFQVLTKRPERMQRYFWPEAGARERIIEAAGSLNWIPRDELQQGMERVPWPLPNVWLGVSVEDQPAADTRIPLLLDTPAAVRFISAEPLLGAVGAERWLHDGDCWLTQKGRDPENNVAVCTCHEPREYRIDWVICGGESGPGARPMHPDWARGLRDQCAAAGVPFFFKQWGEWQNGSNGHYQPGRERVVLTDGRSFRWKDKPSEDWPNLHATVMARVGKKAAGRLLDGVVHDGFPKLGGT